MLNVYPSKPDNVNGSALIKDYPELSRTVKLCAELRRAYLDFFLDGKNLGDCVLAKEAIHARVSGYVKDDEAVVYVVKSNEEDAVVVLDLAPFIPGADTLTVILRNEYNEILNTIPVQKGQPITIYGKADELFVLECKANS